MRDHRILGLLCMGLLSSCANSAARDLGGSNNSTISPSTDAGMQPNNGGNPGSSTGSDTTAGANEGTGDGAADAGLLTRDAGDSEQDAGLVTPSASQLVFSEIMARPSGGSGNEWLELYNAGETSVDLSGCTLTTSEDGRGGTELEGSLSIAPRTYLLFGRDDVEAESGVKPDYVYDGVYLSPDETVSIICGGQVVAKVSYQDAEAAASLQLDQRYVLVGKVDATAFCAGTDALPLSDNLGTPKADNHDCAGVPSP